MRRAARRIARKSCFLLGHRKSSHSSLGFYKDHGRVYDLVRRLKSRSHWEWSNRWMNYVNQSSSTRKRWLVLIHFKEIHLGNCGCTMATRYCKSAPIFLEDLERETECTNHCQSWFCGSYYENLGDNHEERGKQQSYKNQGRIPIRWCREVENQNLRVPAEKFWIIRSRECGGKIKQEQERAGFGPPHSVALPSMQCCADLQFQRLKTVSDGFTVFSARPNWETERY
jgi:hypothetical protein